MLILKYSTENILKSHNPQTWNAFQQEPPVHRRQWLRAQGQQTQSMNDWLVISQ